MAREGSIAGPSAAGYLRLGVALAVTVVFLAVEAVEVFAQSGSVPVPTISVLAVLVAEPATQAPLRIRIAPAQAIPARSFLRLKGLPPTASLSEGHVIAPGSWAVPLAALPNLSMNLPAGAVGRSNVTISLVAEDGAILAEERTELVVRAPVQEKKAAGTPADTPTRGAPDPFTRRAGTGREVGRAWRTRSGAGEHRQCAPVLPEGRAGRTCSRRPAPGGNLRSARACAHARGRRAAQHCGSAQMV